MWRFVPGAKKPGKKRKTTDNDKDDIYQKRARDRIYEQNRRRRNFNVGWKVKFPWLDYDQENNIMFCGCCRKHPEVVTTGKGAGNKNAFKDGTDNFRLDSIKCHQRSDLHQKAATREEATDLPAGPSPANVMLNRFNQQKVDRLDKLARVMRSSRKQTSENHATKNCTNSKESNQARAKSQKTNAPQVGRDFGSFHSSNLKEQVKNAESPSYVPPTLPVKPPNFEEYSSKSIEFGQAAKVKHFFLEKECTFLNHGAFGAVLKEVLDYSHEWQKYVERQPLRFFDRMLFPQIVHVQKRLADFVGCDTSDIVMVSNVTTATNAVLQSLDLDQHSIIYYLNITYGAVKRTIKYVCEKTGAEMQEEKLVFPIEDGNDILDLVDRTLKEGTTLAVFDHISSNYAFIMPIKELVLLCHTKGVPVMIDGAHALGALELNLCYLGADYYTANAHKWFCAPKGCAFLYVKQEKQHTVHGLAISHGHDAGFQSQFSWTGAKDYCAFLSLHAVLNFWNAIGPKVIRDHCHELLVEAVQLFQKKWNAEMLAPIDMHGMMCCLSLPSSFYTDKSELSYSDGEMIQNCLYHDYNIEAPIKCIEETLCVRICAHVYNEMDDYVKLADAILEIEKSMFS